MRLFHKKFNEKSLLFLNITQFLGAMNDNFFKLVIVYLLINVKGQAYASDILATAGAVFVAPFLLFSSVGGILADKLSKKNIIVSVKSFEVLTMIAGIVAVYFKSEIALFVLLFFLATQGAIFGPSKYGIIPEIVNAKNVSKANGVINAFTYLAIIIGTFLASFITDVTHKNFILTELSCIFIAILGLLASIRINKTPPKGSNKRVNFFFIYEVYKSLVLSYKYKHLFTTVLCSAFFLFIGGFCQLNTIPFAMQHLHLGEVGGGYLFLLTAVGIAIGSQIAGKISKENAELGLSCLAGFILSFLFAMLYLFASNLIITIILLISLGIAGGLFLIPIDSFIQIKSPDQKRGQIIAAGNFLSFTGVLLASLMLYLINDKMNLSPATGFAIVGVITFIFSLTISGRFSDLFLPFLAKRILSKFYEIKATSLPPTSSILVFHNNSLMKMFLLYTFLPDLKIFILNKSLKRFPFFSGFLNTIFHTKNLHSFFKTIEKEREGNNYICLLSKNPLTLDLLQETSTRHEHFLFIKVTKLQEKEAFLFKTKLTYSFEKGPV